MTDNEIIKALEEAIEYGCGHYREIEMPTIKNALNLINRQKLEIENLLLHIECFESKIKRLEDGYAEKMQEYTAVSFHLLKTTKAEAYKEFAERLKEKAQPHYFDNYDFAVSIDDIDNLLNELVGEE